MEFIYFILVVFIASALQGITGFGSALIAAPLLLLIFDKDTSVISLSIISIALNLFLFLTINKPVYKKTFYNLFIPAVIGLPFGIILLDILPIKTLRILVGFLAITFAFLLFSKKPRVESTKLKHRFAGLFYGILHTSTGVSAPPVVLILASENTDKDEMRKTLSFFFLMTSIVSILFFIATKHFTSQAVIYSLWGIPAVILGGWFGSLISKRVSQKQFIWSVFILIAVSIIIAISSAIDVF